MVSFTLVFTPPLSTPLQSPPSQTNSHCCIVVSFLEHTYDDVPNLTVRRLNSGDDDLDTALVLDELEFLVRSQGGGGGGGQEAAREGRDEAGVQGAQVLRARVVADAETHQ